MQDKNHQILLQKNLNQDNNISKTGYRALFLLLKLLESPMTRDEILAELNLLENGATVVVEHALQNDLQNLPDCYIIKKSKKYGIAYVDVLTFEI